jgi:BirA family transcriptional regulator, biotin operon repressor / biotin---[acetyl-CoA-carboxylase] ligase
MTALSLGSQAAGDGYRLVIYERLDSTNSEAMRLTRAGEAGLVWIVANEQTAGRGRRGRDWMSCPGNLAATLLTSGTYQPQVAATLSFVASLALAKACRVLAPALPIELKWPNDLLSDGRKLSGILLESHISGNTTSVAIGFGVNLSESPRGFGIHATSLAECGHQVSRAGMLAQLTDAWSEVYRRWDNGNGFAQIRQEWIAHATGVGQPVSIVVGGREERGIFRTLDGQGRLVLDLPDGRCRTVSAGEVYFGDAATAWAQATAGG